MMYFALLTVVLCALTPPTMGSFSPLTGCPPCPCASPVGSPFGGRQDVQVPQGGVFQTSQISQQGRGQVNQAVNSMAGQDSQTMNTKGAPFNDIANPPDAIAFSATRNSSQYFFQAGPVLFNDVITNIGGGYDSRYGVFTAFQPGIYLVRYHVVSQRNSSKMAVVDLLKNDEVVDSASGSGSSGETSNSAVLFLTPHDMLSVQGRAESAIFCGDDGDALCSFSVVLLKLGSFTDSKTPRPVPGW